MMPNNIVSHNKILYAIKNALYKITATSSIKSQCQKFYGVSSVYTQFFETRDCFSVQGNFGDFFIFGILFCQQQCFKHQ